MFTVLQAIAVYEDHHVLTDYAAIVQNVAAGFGFCGEHRLQGLGYGADGEPLLLGIGRDVGCFR